MIIEAEDDDYLPDSQTINNDAVDNEHVYGKTKDYDVTSRTEIQTLINTMAEEVADTLQVCTYL